MKARLALLIALGSVPLLADDYWCLDNTISIRAEYTYLRRQEIRDLRLVEEVPIFLPLSSTVRPKKVMDTEDLADQLGWESGARVGLTFHKSACASLEALYTYVFPWKGREEVKPSEGNLLRFPFKDPDEFFDYNNASRAVGVYESRLQSGELNYWNHMTPQRCDYFSASWLLGARIVYLREEMCLTFTRDFMERMSSSDYSIDTGNVCYGLQLGAVLEINPNSCFTWTFLIKGAGFFNTAKNETRILDEDNSTELAGYVRRSWTSSWLLEGYGQLAYHWSDSFSLHFAYQGYILSGLALAPAQRNVSSSLHSMINKKGQIVIDGLYAGFTLGF